MKKLLILAVMCVPFFAMGQIEKGKQFVTGSVGVYGYSPKNVVGDNIEHYFQTSISGTYGFLLSDRWAIGITPDLTLQWQRRPSGQKARYRGVNVGAFARRYFMVGEKFFLHVDGGVYYSNSYNYMLMPPNGDKLTSSKDSGLNISIQPGATYFLTNKVALTANLGSVSTGWRFTGQDGNTGVGFNVGMKGLTMGAAVYF